MKLSLAELRALAVKHGFPNPDVAAAVAMAESGGDPAIIGDTAPGIAGPSIGLWQVDTYFWKQWTVDQLKDPDTNALAAFFISSRGTKWTPWSTYNSGAYKRWMPAPAPAPAPDDGDPLPANPIQTDTKGEPPEAA